MKKIYRSIVYNYQNGGFLGLFKRGLRKISRFFYRKDRWLIYSMALDGYDSLETRDDVDVKNMSFDDLVSKRYFKAVFYPENIKDRLCRGEMCYGFFLGGDLAHVVWLTDGYLSLEEDIPRIEDERCGALYDLVTFPEHRNKGIFKYALRRMLKVLKERGKKEALAAVDPGNEYSKKGFERVGFKLKDKLSFVQILFFKKFLEE